MRWIKIGGGTNGPHYMKVDDVDFEWLSRYYFSCLEIKRNDGSVLQRYARRREEGKTILAHREIKSRRCLLVAGQEVDHKDHDGLNNQDQNLRVATHSQNMAHSRKQSNSSSKYVGVSLHRKNGNWTAHIQKNGKFAHLGCFKTEIEAAKAYDEEAKEIYGEFASLNF